MESVQKSSNPNPRDKANILSVLTFWWTLDLFKTGYRKVLEVTDLYKPITADYSESLGDRLERKWKQQLSGPGRPSLLKAVLLTFWREYTHLGMVTIINDFFIRIGQPILLGKLLLYFRHNSDIDRQTAIYCACGIVFLSACSAITINQFILDSFHYGMKVRVAMCSIIYRKSLRLSRTALGDTAPGKIVNLLSNDVNRFDIVTVFLHSMWSAPLMTLIVGYLLWLEAGLAGMFGIIIVFIVVPVQSYTGKLSSRFRLQTAWRTDERVRFMDEVISGVQVIKMYAWEKPFSILIHHARKMELNIVRKSAYVRALYMTFMLFTTRCAMFVTMMTLALMKQEITAAKVFVIFAYYSIISNSMSQMFVRGVAEIAEVLVALKRLQSFLMYSEKADEALENVKEKELHELSNGDRTEKEKLLDHESSLPSNVAISVKNADARWVIKEVKSASEKKRTDAYKAHDLKKLSKKNKTKELDHDEIEEVAQPTLQNVSIDFRKGILIGIVGPVGSGKSSLLQVILKELPLENGSVSVRGALSYACQEPWVFAGSVLQNIVFGQEKDTKRYDDVVKACALLPDFAQFPYGDKSLIGERGASLSGGQKARINLARAVYRKAHTYLLDDPLSAVDAHVGRHLFDEVIGPQGRLAKQNATRILVTHQVHYLKDADWIVVLKQGRIEFQGTPFELTKSGIDIAELLDVPEETHFPESKELNESKKSRTNSRSSSRSLKTSKASLYSHIDDAGDETETDEDNEEPRKKSVDGPIAELEKTSRGAVKGSLLGNYLRSGAHTIIVIILLLLFIATQVIASFADFWVSHWTRQEEQRNYYEKLNDTLSTPSNSTIESEINQSLSNDTATDNFRTPEKDLLSTQLCMIIHGSLIGGLFVIALLRSMGFYTVCIRASQKLHDGMFKGIISTTMRFFDINPSGRILNRFSKDMGSVDELLPKAILDASQMLLSMFGSIIVTLYVSPYITIPLAFLAAIFIFVRRVYLKTSKNIKRVEGITRSPVFSHLAATLTGLSTIRAFDAQDILIQEFDGHQDLHSGAWYMFITASTAFGFALDLLCLVFIFLVVFSFLSFNTNILGDKVGLAVSQSLALTGMMQWGVRQSAEVANYMMSVERLLEYCDLDTEKQPDIPKELNKTWPSEGKLEFRNVKYRYSLDSELVLRDLSFLILPQEKIGIVGRTGAGKSSLIGAIFRLAVVEGQILIDDIDANTIALQELRAKVSIIPQDPVLFSGTLRRNLDPFEEYSDEALWSALSDVELNHIASGSPAGLQTSVMSGGSNYSVGQRQLLCLARAILRKNKVLVLDEATANVDPKTDSLIQKTIRLNFANCTVLTVAHRLHTIMDSDRVLVMSNGRCEELASPHELLEKPTGIFKEMVIATGPLESERLIRVARETFESKKNK